LFGHVVGFAHGDSNTIARMLRTSGVFCHSHSFYGLGLFFHLDTYYGGT
jgi:hypothetical protein